MQLKTNRFAGRLSVALVIALLLSITAPAYTADKTTSLPVAISSITDTMGSININVGKGEGIKEGSKGVITRDGKQIAEYVVQQVNWGFSRITVLKLADGYTVRPGDSAPLTGASDESSSPKKKSKSKTLLTVLAIGAAILLLGGGGGGGGSAPAVVTQGNITLSSVRESASGDGTRSCTFNITARIYDSTGGFAANGTPVTFTSDHGSLTVTQTAVNAGRATTKLTYDPLSDPDSATVTIRALGQTATMVVSFVSSIDLLATPTTIQVTGGEGTVTQSTLTATCWDTSGNLATSGTVYFTTTRGTVTVSAPINGSGVATATFSSNVTGDADITATWLTKNKATIPVTVTAGPPRTIVVSANPSTVQCDGSSFSTVTATVKDVRGNVVADGTVVEFSVIPDGTGGGNGTITPQATTLNGVATVYLYTRTAGGATSQSGTARIKADVRVASQPPDVPAPVADVTNQAALVQFISPTVGSIGLSANPANVRGWDIANNTTAITAVVKNVDNQSVPDGTVVYFTATHGIVQGGVSGNMSRTTNGVATATLRTDASGSGAWNGLVDVTASSGGVDATRAGLVIFSGPPLLANSTATISQDTLTAVGGQATIVVDARDVNGNPVVDTTRVTATTSRGTITGNGTTAGGHIEFTLSTSTDPATPTPAGAGTVSVSIEAGSGAPPVTKTVNFTVIP